MTWRSYTASLYFRLTYPHVCGVVRIKRPKLRLGFGRNNHQFSLIEDLEVANYFDWLTASLNEAELDSDIWPTGASGFLPYWESVARLLQVASLNLVPAHQKRGPLTETKSTLAKRANDGTLLARGDVCSTASQNSSASLRWPKALLLFWTASITCAAYGHAMHDRGWFGALRSVSADFEVCEL